MEVVVRDGSSSAWRVAGAQVRDAGAVVARAAALLGRHGPTLVAVWLVGDLVADRVVVAAVRASELHRLAGLAVLVLAPMAELTALVVMLRVMRTSAPLPAPTPVDGPRGVRIAAMLESTASVLVPYLAVWVSLDAFRVLFSTYTLRIIEDETSEIFANVDVDVPAPTGGSDRQLPLDVVLVGAMVVAFAVRWILRQLGPSRRSGVAAGRAVTAAWVEVMWLVLAFFTISQWRRDVWPWVRERRVVRAAGDVVGGFVDSLGPVTAPLRAGWRWIGEATGALGSVILVPISLLTVGAIVYGATVARPQPLARPALPGRAQTGLERVRARLAVVPTRLRRASRVEVVRLGSRFRPLVNGLRLLARAGLVPMMLFCVAYAVVDTVDSWMWLGWRRLVGPQEIGTWIAASPLIATVNRMVVAVLGAVLVAAAIERFLTMAAQSSEVTNTAESSDGTTVSSTGSASAGSRNQNVRS